jgi:Methyltransferase domain
MYNDLLRDIAESQMPPVQVEIVAGTTRFDVINSLPDQKNVGIELGVAAGSFSARMMQSGRFKRFYGVDIYGDTHDIGEYKKALRAVGLHRNFHLLRMTFDDALDLFPDGHFDFIYCDGYAHTGEEGGRTLLDWYAKLKPGGVMAGDDYDLARWPLVVWAVHNLVAQLQVPLRVTDVVSDVAYNRFRSWYFTKPAGSEPNLTACQPLMDLGDIEKASKAEQRAAKVASRKKG